MRHLFIAQQPLQTYYAGVLLSASAAASWVTRDTDVSAPSVAEFLEAVGSGRLKPGAPQTKHVLGEMFLMPSCPASIRHGSTQRFSEAGRSVLRRLSVSPMAEYAGFIRGPRGARIQGPSLPPRRGKMV
jgi:hypothetical protein